MQLKSRLRPRTGPCRRHCIGTYNLSRSVSNFDARVMSRGGRDWRSRVAPALNPFINAAGAPQAFSEKSRKSRFGTKPVSFELSRLVPLPTGKMEPSCHYKISQTLLHPEVNYLPVYNRSG